MNLAATEAIPPTLEFSRCAMNGVMQAGMRFSDKLFELNSQAFSAAVDEHSAIAAEAQSPVEMASLQAGMLLAAPKKALSYWRHVGTIAVEAYAEIALESERCFSETLPDAQAFFESLANGSFVPARSSWADGTRILMDETMGTEAVKDVQIVDSEGNAVGLSKR